MVIVFDFPFIFSHSFWCRNKKLGKITLVLEIFDFTFETSMWCQIQTDTIKVPDGALFEIISDNSLITDEPKWPSFWACNSMEWPLWSDKCPVAQAPRL